MKHRRLIRLAFVGCGTLTLLIAQKEVFVSGSDVSFTISTAKSRYGHRASITVRYRIVNISNAPVYVPRAWERKCPAKPHVWAWFESSAGTHFTPGYGGSCSPIPQGVAERMAKEAILLKPGDATDGALELDAGWFGGLPPGPYRIEAVLYCWNLDEFSAADRQELSSTGKRFVSGQIPASLRITLLP
jgi:hypothetical protein